MSEPLRNYSYSDQISRMYETKDITYDGCRSITFQVTDDCCCACSYCYQTNKGHRMMSKETATQIVDLLFRMYDEDVEGAFISKKTPGVILEFIGGEPLMNIELIDYVCTYFMNKCIELHHPWLYTWRASMISNGAYYFQPEVRDFIKKFKNYVSFDITLDGPKEIHDACRKYHNGEGNFDDAYKAFKAVKEEFGNIGTKVTIAPENLHNLNTIIDFFINEGVKIINANCVYEHDWTKEEAQVFYKELKVMADKLIKYPEVSCSLFTKDFLGTPIPEDDLQTWCWGEGTPILTKNGYKNIEDLKIGDLVYTHTGELKPIIKTTTHFAENTIKIHLSGNFDMICTDNHKLFTKPFNYIGNKYTKHYKPDQKMEVKNILHQDLVQLFKLPNNRIIDYNKDLAYIVGRYVGDGWDKLDSKEHLICCSFEEKDELINYFNKANIKYSITTNKTVEQFYIAKQEQNNECHRILSQCGHLAHNKHFPPEVFMWNNDSLEALIKGYLDADGSKTKDRIKCNTVSYQLAQELLIILRTLGYKPTCYKNNRAGKSIILNREVNIKDRYEIYFMTNKKAKYIIDNDEKLWSYGLKTTRAEPQQVYNITVADNHSYIAGGIISSNCGGTGLMLAFDPDGKAYPCLRYMESSLNNEREPIIIGNSQAIYTNEYAPILEELRAVNRRTKCTDECFYCPIARGCADCAAWNYQESGKINFKTKHICNMHKVQVLANVYFWNKQGIKFELNLPKDECLKFISENEYNMLIKLIEDVE